MMAFGGMPAASAGAPSAAQVPIIFCIACVKDPIIICIV